MENNNLEKIEGAAELVDVLRSVESAKTLDELAELTETMHNVNHLLSDSLEEK